jgi:hypothetical protein
MNRPRKVSVGKVGPALAPANPAIGTARPTANASRRFPVPHTPAAPAPAFPLPEVHP